MATSTDPSFPYIDTSIPTLGRCDIPSPLPGASTFEENPSIVLNVDEPLTGGLTKPRPLTFEMAGPRRHLYFDPCNTRCAVVTCGGLCPGINDVIRAIVMTACDSYNIPSVLGIRYGLQGFNPASGYGIEELTVERVRHIHEFGGSILGSSYGYGDQTTADIVNTLERLNINVLFIIGGDGSMRNAAEIQHEVTRRGRKLSVIGFPRTIDNDISFIPRSFGFETAVSKATEAIRCAYTEASSLPNGIGIVKLMGRKSGFIAANAALTFRNVNFVLVPEIPFTLEGEHGLLPALERCIRERGEAVIVLAEGAGQEVLAEAEGHDAATSCSMGDILELVRKASKNYLESRGVECNIKCIDPSYMIRSVPASANDRRYCGFLGQHGVHAAMAGKTGMAVAKLRDKFVYLPLQLVTRRRTMTRHSDLWRSVLEMTGQGESMGMSGESLAPASTHPAEKAE